jgi:hypothetical protein
MRPNRWIAARLGPEAASVWFQKGFVDSVDSSGGCGTILPSVINMPWISLSTGVAADHFIYRNNIRRAATKKAPPGGLPGGAHRGINDPQRFDNGT